MIVVLSVRVRLAREERLHIFHSVLRYDLVRILACILDLGNVTLHAREASLHLLDYLVASRQILLLFTLELH